MPDANYCDGNNPSPFYGQCCRAAHLPHVRFRVAGAPARLLCLSKSAFRMNLPKSSGEPARPPTSASHVLNPGIGKARKAA